MTEVITSTVTVVMDTDMLTLWCTPTNCDLRSELVYGSILTILHHHPLHSVSVPTMVTLEIESFFLVLI